MSKEYIGAFVIVLSQILPMMGIEVTVEALGVTANTIIAIVAGIGVMIARYGKGNINVLGARK